MSDKKRELINQLYDQEHKRSNTVNLEAYTKGLNDMYDALNNYSVLHGISDSCLEKADMWYCTHKDHVNKKYAAATSGYPPSETEDMNNPSLWKCEHWKWYVDNYR